MTQEQWLRIKRIAGDAWDQPESARAAFVAKACTGDAWLHHEVEGLLRSAVAAAGLYETPALTMADGAAAVDDATSAAIAGLRERAGPYRLIREIGRGGMGSVYLAERVDADFEQRVAIKFVGGVPSAPLLRRFRDERRILAALSHPHIATLLDGGSTEDGSPYVVMEYVDGVPIDQYCDARNLRLRDRVALFRKVCAAVHYAHQRLVVHRDIKAANILVTAEGTPKLLDFGIAKIVEPDGGVLARTTLRALTPESASPEQIRGAAITIAADVYALGVLLYRLLTGLSPYGEQRSEGALLQAICDTVPGPPSAAARRAGNTPRAGTIDRDLDLIVLKALRKEPERRYSSVEQFADDLARYLDGLPVLAAPDSRTYRAVKFVRRHRVPVAAAMLAVVALVGGAAVALHQASVAAGERARAEERLAEVRRLANSFLFEFHDAIADLPGALAARQLVVKRAAEHLDGLAREVDADVSLQRELATANMRLGDILGGGGVSNLGDLEGAKLRYATALAIRTTLAAGPEREAADIDELARMHVQLSRFTASLADFNAAEDHAQQAVAALQRRLPSSEGASAGGYVATAFQQLGFVQARRGKTTEALASLEAARSRAQQAFDSTPGDPLQAARLSRIHVDYADQLVQAQRPDEAIRLLVSARGWLEQLLAGDPLNTRHKQILAYVWYTQGAARRVQGSHREAIAAFTSAFAISESLLAAEPSDQGSRMAVLQSAYALGAAHLNAGDRRAGLARLRQAIATGDQLLRAAPTHDYARHLVASARLELGEALLNRTSDSSEGCREVLAGLRVWRDAAARGRLPGESAPFLPRFEALATRCGGND